MGGKDGENQKEGVSIVAAKVQSQEATPKAMACSLIRTSLDNVTWTLMINSSHHLNYL